MKRVMRLLPPWIFGGLLFSFSQMGFMNKEFTVDYFFFSHLWFIWALAAFTAGCLPYHILLRTLVMDDKEVSVSLLREFMKNEKLVAAEQDSEQTRVCGLKKQLYLPMIIGGNISWLRYTVSFGTCSLAYSKVEDRWLRIYNHFCINADWYGLGQRSDFCLPKIISSMMFLADCLQVLAAFFVPLAMFLF